MNDLVSAVNLMKSFPYELSKDKNLNSLAEVVATALAGVFNDNRLITLYARIDALPEDLLDILASDYDVRWYDFNGTLESKREQIKDHFAAHRKLGTERAIFNAIRGLCTDIKIKNWYEYGGKPHHFELEVAPKPNFALDEVIRLTRFAKRESSCMDDIRVVRPYVQKLKFSSGAYFGVEIKSKIIGGSNSEI